MTFNYISLGEQLRVLAEEYSEDDLELDQGVCEEENDYVTCVTQLPYDANDRLLLYGTRSGAIFGLSAETRSKLFSLPFPLPENATASMTSRHDVIGLAMLPPGILAVCYEGCGVVFLDFTLQNPPHRPPTRGAMK